MTHMNRKDPAMEILVFKGWHILFSLANMGRRRISHELITNESVRRVTFKKRKGGLLKKLSELTILCGIPACAIIYSAYSDEPEVWPNRPDAEALLDRFHKLPVEKQTKHMLDQGNFLGQMIRKWKKELEKQKWKNHSIKLGLLASKKDLNDADYSEELMVAARVLEHKIRAVNERIRAEGARAETAATGDEI